MGNEGETPKSTAAASICSAIQQPAAMREDGNIALNWREWKSSFDYYLSALGKDTAPAKEKCALFLHVIGRYGREIFEELDLSEILKVDYENLILTQIIRGIKDSTIRERLLAKETLSLESAVSWCRAIERAGKQAERCGRADQAAPAPTSADPALDELGAGARGRGRYTARRLPQRYQPRPQRAYKLDYGDRSAYACDKCGHRHGSDNKCKAKIVSEVNHDEEDEIQT
ncbi:unnamed protein product, partial [Iphiclides podalirius]